MGTILASLTIVLLLRGSQSRDGGDKGEKGDERVLHFCGVFGCVVDEEYSSDLSAGDELDE